MKKILAIVAVAVIGSAALAAERPYSVKTTLIATNIAQSTTNAYSAGSASDNLVAQKMLGPLVVKFTGATFTNPVVTFTRTSGSLSYNFLVVTCTSNTTTTITNVPPYVWRTGDILGITVSPQHTNTTVVETFYE